MKMNYLGWHVLYVKSKHEKKVDFLLKDLELDSFLPTITTIRQWADRKKKVIKPLFPSYVFLNVHSKNEFHKALQVAGVFKYVRFGENFAKVRNDEIKRIKQLLNLEGISEVDSVTNIPFKGEKMSINYGSLIGLDCVVLKVNNRNKVFVRIESLKRNITAIVPPVYLSKRVNKVKDRSAS